GAHAVEGASAAGGGDVGGNRAARDAEGDARRVINHLSARSVALRSDPTLNPNKALWEKGDFTRIAESMRASGEALVRGLGITPGLEVLDLGCGDGTTAIP